MVNRIAAWVLLVVCAVQLANLWPLPSEVAAQQLKFWTDLKATWEAIDPVTSESPQWTAKAKPESLARINEILANPDELLFQARYEWVLWLLFALLTLAAAFAAGLASRHWPWLVASLVAFWMWLQQPWRAFGMFFIDGKFDLSRGVHQLNFISERNRVMAGMMFFNVIVPIVLIVLAMYGVRQMIRGRSHAL